jgi:hypothetical protein
MVVLPNDVRWTDPRAARCPAEERCRIGVACGSRFVNQAVFSYIKTNPGWVTVAVIFKPLPEGLIHCRGDFLCNLDVVIDDPVGARHEAGDLIQAEIDWNSVSPLANALAGGLSPNAPNLFKSVGCAAWDLAACRVAREALAEARRRQRAGCQALVLFGPKSSR